MTKREYEKQMAHPDGYAIFYSRIIDENGFFYSFNIELTGAARLYREANEVERRVSEVIGRGHRKSSGSQSLPSLRIIWLRGLT
jgi:hypothetical protein